MSYVYGDDLLSQDRAGIESFYLYDGLGSTRSLTDSFGVETDAYTYTAFGELEDQIGSTENSYLYTGEQFDPNLGFYYLRARYMNPAIGRFHSMDSFAGFGSDPVTLHKYLYVGGNPQNDRDPSGYASLLSVSVGQSIFAQSVLSAVGTLNAISRVVDTIGFVNSLAQAVRGLAASDLSVLQSIYGDDGLASRDSEFQEKISSEGLQRAAGAISANSGWLIKAVLDHKRKALSTLLPKKNSKFLFYLPTPDVGGLPAPGPIPTGLSIPVPKFGLKSVSVIAGGRGTRMFGVGIQDGARDQTRTQFFRLDWKIKGIHSRGDATNFDYRKLTGEYAGYEIHVPR